MDSIQHKTTEKAKSKNYLKKLNFSVLGHEQLLQPTFKFKTFNIQNIQNISFSLQLTHWPNKPGCYITAVWKCLSRTNTISYWTSR